MPTTTTVVMLDDNPDDLDIMAMAADDAPAVRFVPCDDPVAAVAALSRAAGSGDALALLLDWHLPGGQGPATLQAVRSDPHTATAYVMVNTGSDDPADRRAALAAGADGYSVKPAGFEASVALVTEVVRRARPAPG